MYMYVHVHVIIVYTYMYMYLFLIWACGQYYCVRTIQVIDVEVARLFLQIHVEQAVFFLPWFTVFTAPKGAYLVSGLGSTWELHAIVSSAD